jgi:rhamnose transport system permease protein
MTSPGNRAAGALLRFRELGIGGVVVAMVLTIGVLEPRFFDTDNLRIIALSIGILLIVALGQTVVIISRNIDLSVGSTLGLAAMVTGMAMRENPDLPTVSAVGVAVAVGASAGAVNGALIAFGNVPAIITTLGTLAIYRGLIFIVSDGVQVNRQDIPADFTRLATSSPIGVAWIVVIAVLAAGAAAWYLGSTRSGRYVYATGSNPEGARARGVPVRAVTVVAFIACGALAGLGGAMYVARFATVNPADAGRGFELAVITAVVIGGTNIFGGSGTVLGTVMGCLLIGVLANGLAVTGVSGFWQSAVQGLIILGAVIFDARVRRGHETRRLAQVATP